MNYWLDLFTPHTWTRFVDHNASVTGFRPRQRKAAFEKVNRGDLLLCYLVKLSRWCGVLEVTSDAYEDSSPVFADSNDPFPIRFKVKAHVALSFENSIPIERPELWNSLSFTRDIAKGSPGWAQFARLRQSLIQISSSDGRQIQQALEAQNKKQVVYQLDRDDLRHITQREVVRTEQGEVEVEVPDRDDEPIATHAEHEGETRASLIIQAKVAQLGATLGFSVWIPPNDRQKIRELLPPLHCEKLVDTLPLNYDPVTLRTIANIDVIWLQRRAILRAFEVEHTTSIYSGLLRMADLLAMQPRMNISLHIVAPEDRRDQVRREILRPVFSVLEGGPMSDKCSYLTYDSIGEILAKPDLGHMRETVLDDYEEYFEP
jgi:hypothetical protein